jgi:GNAT superfamily N-acetyltransferase
LSSRIAQTQTIEKYENSLSIRFATYGDLDNIVNLHLKCIPAKGNIARILGTEFITAMYRRFLSESGCYVIMAEENGKLAGHTVVTERPFNGPVILACKRQAAFALLKKPWLVLNPRLLGRLLKTVLKKRSDWPKNAAYLAYGMVDPLFRRKGIITALRKEIYNISHMRGITMLVSRMTRNNIPIINFNKKLGAIEDRELSTNRHICMVNYVDKQKLQNITILTAHFDDK